MTLAQVDPAILTCWEEMLKRGEECSLLLKHSKGKVTFSLQGTTKSSSLAEISLPLISSAKKKKRKQKRKSQKRLEALLSYQQRLVEEKGLPPSRLMLKHAGEQHSNVSNVSFLQHHSVR